MARASIVGIAATCALGCGGRTGLELGASIVSADASVDARVDVGVDSARAPDTPFDAAGCPPAPTTWSESIVAAGVDSYAIARDDACSVVVVWGDGSSMDAATLEKSDVWSHSPLGVNGVVVAAAITGSTLHVLYNDGKALRYVARRDGVVGASELVDPLGLARGEMAIDAAGVAHAVYPAINGTLSDLHHATRAAGGWTVERLDARQSFEPSIAIDASGRIYVAYEYVASSEDHACVLGATNVGGGGWTFVDLPRIDPLYSSSDPCTVRVTDVGVVHLSYGAYGIGPPPGPLMRHAYGSFPSLAFENVEPLGSFGDDPRSSWLDASGALRLAYRSTDGALHAATLRPGAPPTIETVTSRDSQGVLVVVDRAGVTNVVADRKGILVVARRGP